MIETHDVSRHGRGKQIAGSGRILQHVELIAIVESHTDNGSQVGIIVVFGVFSRLEIKRERRPALSRSCLPREFNPARSALL